jgi:hypothetical protein
VCVCAVCLWNCSPPPSHQYRAMKYFWFCCCCWKASVTVAVVVAAAVFVVCFYPLPHRFKNRVNAPKYRVPSNIVYGFKLLAAQVHIASIVGCTYPVFRCSTRAPQVPPPLLRHSDPFVGSTALRLACGVPLAPSCCGWGFLCTA